MSAYSPPSPQPTQVAAPMAPPTLQSTLLSGTTGTILAAVGDAEAHVGRRELRFPRIAVFGDESTGKSSVLEAVCRIPFPRGATTTTRCPISVRLVRRLDAPWGASAWLGPGRRHEVHLQRPEDVAEAVARLQQINIDEVSRKGGDAKFSEFPVTVEVKAHDNVDLTLLDLPGYFIHQGRDPTQPESDVIRIKSTLMECISDPRTILLVILRASQVFKTANIFNLLKEYEKGLSAEQLRAIQARTIYCMTMVRVATRVSLQLSRRAGSSTDLTVSLPSSATSSAAPMRLRSPRRISNPFSTMRALSLLTPTAGLPSSTTWAARPTWQTSFLASQSTASWKPSSSTLSLPTTILIFGRYAEPRTSS